MLGYKLMPFKARPAEAWAEMKRTANYLAESICQMLTRLARDAENVSGQKIFRVEIRKGNFRISSLRNSATIPTWKAKWERIQIYNYHQSWCLSLPEATPSHWPIRASVARMVMETLASVSEQDVRASIDEALEE